MPAVTNSFPGYARDSIMKNFIHFLYIFLRNCVFWRTWLRHVMKKRSHKSNGLEVSVSLCDLGADPWVRKIYKVFWSKYFTEGVNKVWIAHTILYSGRINFWETSAFRELSSVFRVIANVGDSWINSRVTHHKNESTKLTTSKTKVTVNVESYFAFSHCCFQL